ncbi:hypothetical protein CERZMDRAFT_93032 [Cercospora zeae-maydis SCOH1-5]|uniref:Uncharacterized protein n=1 Tax=Cercospora zeae-maydis SCOH1-5 TaxID=717836 RepID=A0A6A6FU64_9PEZI|nr:hypothetical protein CERZMDRAFT_93032 [Cercospora zeae-maydis SCOH1-5]
MAERDRDPEISNKNEPTTRRLHSRSGLQFLPNELLYEICRLLFLSCPITILSTLSNPTSLWAPAPLLSCRRIHRETVDLFYSTTTFQFPARVGVHKRIVRWLSNLPRTQAQRVHKLELHVSQATWCNGTFGLESLAGSPNVKAKQLSQIITAVRKAVDNLRTTLTSPSDGRVRELEIWTNFWVPKQSLLQGIGRDEVMEACRGHFSDMDSLRTRDPWREVRREMARVRRWVEKRDSVARV